VANVGNSFSLPFKTANWLSTFFVMGLISLIPIVGALAITGWMLTLLDNYRQGRTDLPPAGFQYLGRGVNVFVVQLVYGLVLVVVVIVPFLLILVVAAGSSAGGDGASSAGYGTTPGGGAFFAFFPLWGAGISLFSVVLYVFLPAVVYNTERGGIGGGLNVGRVWATASHQWSNTLLAAVIIFAANFIGSMGIYACCVGYLVSLPYAYAVMAGVYRYYEAAFEAVPPGPAPMLTA
jgi:hypothetical protein